MKYLIQLVNQIESFETRPGSFLGSLWNELNLAVDEFVRKNLYSKKEIQDGRYVTLTHLKKTIKIEIDIEDDLKERAHKHREDELDHSQQDFKQFTEKLDLVKEEIKIMKNVVHGKNKKQMSKNCPLSFPNRFQRIHTKEEEEGEKNYRQKNPHGRSKQQSTR